MDIASNKARNSSEQSSRIGVTRRPLYCHLELFDFPTLFNLNQNKQCTAGILSIGTNSLDVNHYCVK